MSWITAPTGEVTIAMRRGSAGKGRFRAGAKSPSFSSRSFSSSKACCSDPFPSGSSTSTESRYSPRGAKTPSEPRARTLRPSRGLKRTSRAALFHSTAWIWELSSLSEKYQWPEAAVLRLLTSPSTHTSKNSTSRAPRIRSVSWVTVRARRGAGRGASALFSLPPKSRPFCSMLPTHSISRISRTRVVRPYTATLARKPVQVFLEMKKGAGSV